MKNLTQYLCEEKGTNTEMVVELTPNSQSVLMDLCKKLCTNNKGFEKAKYLCDHYTVYAKCDDTSAKYYKNHKNDKIEFTVTHIGISENVIAVKVLTETKTSYENKFIVLALAKGGKESDADSFTTWDRIGFGYVLSGKLKIKEKVK